MLILEDGGTGLLEERNAASVDIAVCTAGTFSKFLCIQRNISVHNVLTNTQLIIPSPRNVMMIQVSRGKQIAVLEVATHNACRDCRIRLRLYNQSAAPILKVPKMAAITCNAKISNN